MHVIITCKYKKDRMKNSQGKVATSIFRRSREASSVVRDRSGRISNSSMLLCMPSLPASMKRIRSITAYKYKKDRMKKQPGKSGNTVFPIITLWRFFPTQMGSLLRSRWSNRAEFRTAPSFHSCYRYLQVFKGSDENNREKVATLFPH